MNNLSCVFVVGLALTAFGCKKKGGGGGGDCATAITHSMELAKPDMAKMPGMDDKMLQKMKDIGLQHCTEDKWSDDVTRCMVEAKTEAESQTCYGKLSHDQQEKMNKAAMEAAQPAENPGGTGSAATGSDTGSAAGSAVEGSAAPAGSNTGSAGSAAPAK